MKMFVFYAIKISKLLEVDASKQMIKTFYWKSSYN